MRLISGYLTFAASLIIGQKSRVLLFNSFTEEIGPIQHASNYTLPRRAAIKRNKETERDGEMNRAGICEKGSQFFLGPEVNDAKPDNMALMAWHCVMALSRTPFLTTAPETHFRFHII